MVSEIIRVGIIGGGIWGTFHLRAAKEYEEEGRENLVAIADKSEEIAHKQSQQYGIAKYTDYQEMITHEDRTRLASLHLTIYTGKWSFMH